jgi:hypothetical protein
LLSSTGTGQALPAATKWQAFLAMKGRSFIAFLIAYSTAILLNAPG